MKLTQNDMRVLHAMRNVLHPSRGGNGDFDGFIPHGSRDWIAPNSACECPGCETARERAKKGETTP